jgi:hypothetical protein
MALRSRKRKRNIRKSKNVRRCKTYKMRGGRNIGANCNDPNFSIYNTRGLTLFPYKPN